MRKILFMMILIPLALLSGQTRFNHILITNDDGIEDSKRLIALAKSVLEVADRVSVVVSEFDRSGTSNYSTYGKYKSVFEVTCQYYDESKNIGIYTIPGNPADCVMLGLSGFMGGNVPDLVLSGINGGPNIGPGWFGSGTIGAARTAAFFGVKAIAFSGFEDDWEESFKVTPEWITKFISSGILSELDRKSYLTVGFPRIPFNEIKGVKICERRIVYNNPDVFSMKKIWGEEVNKADSKTIWTPEIKGIPVKMEDKYDDYYLRNGYVVISPMTIDENNIPLLGKLNAQIDQIPKFTE